MKSIRVVILAGCSAALLSFAGCAAVTVRPGGGPKLAAKPDYQESKPYFFWGLSGEHEIDVAEVCAVRGGVEQFQSRFEVLDVVFGGITLGIYSPKSARVWCKEGGAR